MKILAFVDLHGRMRFLSKLKSKAEKADVIVCAGDFTVFQAGMRRILSAFNRLGKKVLLVHGNHEDDRAVEDACSGLGNIVFIHKKSYAVGNYLFIGYGGMGFSAADSGFERFSKRFVGKKNVVLVTHAPPHNTKLDSVWGNHQGNKSITSFIRQAKPLLAVCGHLHENEGKEDNIGKTRVINPGPGGKMVEI